MFISWLSAANNQTVTSNKENWESFLVRLGVTHELSPEHVYPSYEDSLEEDDDPYEDYRTFVHRVGQRVPGTSEVQKVRLPAFSPAEFEDLGGGTYGGRVRRANKNVVAIHMACFDFDDLDQSRFYQVLDFARDYRHAIYSSFSHGKNASIKMRLVMPFSRPVKAEEWKDLWHDMMAWVPGEPDPKCGDLARIFFTPNTSLSRVDQSFTWHQDGYVLDPDEIPSAPKKAKPEDFIPEITRPVDVEQLRGELKSVRDDLQTPFKALLLGKPFARSGERHNVMVKMTHQLTRKFPDGDLEDLVKMFKSSLHAMAASDSDFDFDKELESVRSALISSMEKRLIEKAEHKNNDTERRRRRIHEYTKGVRDTEYTTEELESYAKKLDVGDTTWLKKHILLIDGTSVYTLVGGEYVTPPTKTTHPLATDRIRNEMSPFPESYAPTERTHPKTGLSVPYTMAELMENYGIFCTQTSGSLHFGGVKYERSRREIVHGFGGVVECAPEFSPVVDQWLRLLAGDSYSTLEAWLKYCTDLTRPLPALYLEGNKGVGKTLLAHCVSMLWGKQPLSADLVESRFQILSEGPVVFADEELPYFWKNRYGSAKFRSFLTSPSRTVDRKHISPISVDGYMRVMMTANNSKLLDFTDNLTQADREAILERVIHIRADDSASAFLKSLDFSINDIKTGGMFQQHAAWIRENVKTKRAGRFSVEQDSSPLSDHLAVVGKSTRGVLGWLLGYLRDPKKLERVQSIAKDYILVREGALYVNPAAMLCGMDWSLYGGSVRNSPDPIETAAVMKDVSSGESEEFNGTMFYHIDLCRLALYGDSVGGLNLPQIKDSLRAIERSRKKATPVLCD